MKLGYMTNAFGPLVGSGGGVTSVKDIRYLTMCDDEDVLKRITDKGFRYIEVLEGNMTKYADNPDELKKMLEKYGAEMMSICAGANFIYPDALEDEMAHMKDISKMAADIGVKYVVLCGGAIRAAGTREEDYQLLAKGLDEAKAVIESFGLTACYHPHLGSIAENSEQIDKLFALTDIAFCPDTAHLAAGGSDPLEKIKKYYDRIAFVHLKDLKNGEFAPLGTGEIDLKGIIEYLKGRGYDGDWLVEVDGYSGDPDEACQISYDFLKGLLI